jgi:hypothetical protein
MALERIRATREAQTKTLAVARVFVKSRRMAAKVKSGGNRTPMELFLAGLRGWDSEIRQKFKV